MFQISSRSKISRRDFLKLLAAAGATAAGGSVLATYTPWLNYEQAANQPRETFVLNQAEALRRRELVRCATLAANGHNTQPWKFALLENAIEIHPDLTRQLEVVDPDHRELWISLGCALENLTVAARAAGYAPEVTYPDAADFIHVRLTPDSAQGSDLFDAIPRRQNTRSEYDGQPVETAVLDQLLALPLEPGVTLRFITHPAEMETTLEYVNRGNLSQYADTAFIDELIFWLRFNKKDALAALDGLYSVCSGNPEVPRWLGQMFVAGTKPQEQADADAKKLRSSAGVVLVTSATDDKTGWVRTGQVYERLALKMTALKIQSAFLNQPIEVADLRGQFQSASSLGNSLPQLLVRYGHGKTLPCSLRRPVDTVLI
ncbi:MAG: twin-arginine translocation signal domain-containing protein [Chloroflexi bacterium]|nr:MAG: twin-arginine translocation signal domain-containing protein [Chloroflexota bacterium]